MEFLVDHLSQLEQVAAALIKYAEKRKKMTLSGEIGAGKTTFVKAFCKKLGVQDKVSSPTFSLINTYAFNKGDQAQETLIHHMDLYRLKTPEEALEIGIEDYLYNEDYCLIEWPGLISYLLPEDTIEIKFEFVDISTRKIIFL